MKKLPSEILAKYEAVIGLEIHVQLSTQSKMFATEAAGLAPGPNRHVSLIAMAHPGALPSINLGGVEKAVRFGMAIHGEIAQTCYFDRKHYFYPDSPKGYQMTQDGKPYCMGGRIEFPMPDGEIRGIDLHHIHIEEDAGKSLHQAGKPYTQVDLNRAGTPLIEIVTLPTLHEPEEAGALMAEVRRLVRYLDVGDGDMEKGNLRCDANISIRPKGVKTLGTRAEIKNVNSINFVIRALKYEFQRQVQLVEAGEEIVQETRTWDAQAGKTFGMRDKENAHDYRYFPEPDLLPIHLSEAWMSARKAELLELPIDRYRRYLEAGLSVNESLALIEQIQLSAYFDQLVEQVDSSKTAANWLLGPVKAFLNQSGQSIEQFPLGVDQLVELITWVKKGQFSRQVAIAQVLPAWVESPSAPLERIAQQLDLLGKPEADEIGKILQEVLDAFPKEANRLKQGEMKLIGFFIGQANKKFKGKADPKAIKTAVMEWAKS
ncbi:Asp-tRNA(Asn)/Glu-tRNA(Gln) amidotransferase subunit GatB [Pontibacter sp. G13]|uniref:Asp-tRNA(Asn)/Glu-tRNA(Gln) amidotransferase subunit GatB n=1 Tax=Pontibacter sp. G13 TaxID=3074898 RepID=UPI00288B5809|nr:Asp-tRNA(Asn)/Glu-tRNA(Gln) amidotransferase subunit GatB [Pontibacter sp. G13]WNJ16009.1 Asp-tRNA(Asn)/Glu-tRNA(Gln) amidotransferase subunit GatB [Pontibacter sp. G13]